MRTLTPTDLWNLARVGPVAPVPGGDAAVVVVTTFEDDTARSRLWMVTADGGRRPLTRPDRSASAPVVSGDGRRLAFLAKDPEGDEPAQVHVLHLGGGEAEPVTDLPLGARAVLWGPGDERLVVSAPLYRSDPTVGGSAAERTARKERGGRPVVTEDRVYRFWKRWLAGDTLDHLFAVSPDSPDAALHLTPGLERLTSLHGPEGTFDVAGDGSIAFCIDVSEPAWDRPIFAVHVIGPDGGTPVRLSGRPGQQRFPRFSPDGGSIVFGWQEDPDFYADRVRLVAHRIGDGTETVLTEDWDRSPDDWRFDDWGGLVITAEDSGHLGIWRLDGAGTRVPVAIGAGSHHGARPAGAAVWYLTESAIRPAAVARAVDGANTIIADFNDEAMAGLTLGRYEEIEIDGVDGAPVQVQITYPPAFDPAVRWPLVHNVHGGPHNASLDQWHWRWNTQAMAATGYVVASVNFRGSSSWGQDFATSIRGSWGDLPTTDVLAATDHLVALGFVDDARMAVAGGSYGGYLTSWVTARTNRFRCAIVHAGVTDLAGQWASDITAGREDAVGGTPWDDLAAVQRWSPVANMEAVVTPTLVIHGELDYRVVVTQGLVWYGLLKAKGVPARLVYFPDEGHWIEKRGNALVWWDEVTGWLHRWLGDEEGPELKPTGR